MALVIEKWLDASIESDAGALGKRGTPTSIVFIDNEEVTRIKKYPSDPIQLPPKKMSANLMIRFHAREEGDILPKGNADDPEVLGELVITMGKLLQFGMPLYTSLCFGVPPPPKGKPSPIDVKEALRNAARADRPKVCITLFRPMQKPGARSRLLPDVKQALVSDEMEWCTAPTEQQGVTASGQVQGLIDCVRAANTTLIAYGNRVTQLESELELAKDDQVLAEIKASRAIVQQNVKDVEAQVRDATRTLEDKVRELEIERDTLRMRLMEYEDQDKARSVVSENAFASASQVDVQLSDDTRNFPPGSKLEVKPADLMQRMAGWRERARRRSHQEARVESAVFGQPLQEKVSIDKLVSSQLLEVDASRADGDVAALTKTFPDLSQRMKGWKEKAQKRAQAEAELLSAQT